MKLLLLTGGLLGFGIGFGIGLVREQSLPHALAHACVALYVGAMLMRWWGRVWIKALEESRQEESRD
ncbi:MAG: hypothetical protein ABSA12_07080 [Verrucomicrobiia bacterium]|jgi:hypothetical protein